MKKMRISLVLLPSLLLCACGKDFPSALGLEWKEPVELVDGVETQRSYTFTETGLTVARRCGDRIQSVTAPVVTEYLLHGWEGIRTERRSGSGGCTLTLTDGLSRVQRGGGSSMIVSFADGDHEWVPNGFTNGIFGEWTDLDWEEAEVDFDVEIDELTMSAVCNGGGVVGSGPQRVYFIVAIQAAAENNSDPSCGVSIEQQELAFYLEDENTMRLLIDVSFDTEFDSEEDRVFIFGRQEVTLTRQTP